MDKRAWGRNGGGSAPAQTISTVGWTGSGTVGNETVRRMHLAAFVPRTHGANPAYVYNAATGKSKPNCNSGSGSKRIGRPRSERSWSPAYDIDSGS
jgi:hypothetical protein